MTVASSSPDAAATCSTSVRRSSVSAAASFARLSSPSRSSRIDQQLILPVPDPPLEVLDLTPDGLELLGVGDRSVEHPLALRRHLLLERIDLMLELRAIAIEHVELELELAERSFGGVSRRTSAGQVVAGLERPHANRQTLDPKIERL